MILDTEGLKPIYLQIAEWIEEEILHGNLDVDDKVYSQYKLADMYTINPATAAKGLKMLADEGILYDRRGLGKFVASDAKTIILEKRKDESIDQLMESLVKQAVWLGMSEEELLQRVKKVWRERTNENR
ncbi:GntR family transcriptional regulator [Halobacillus litoralis]|uniref:GntR family transcriptional regulator n=1 Tax=Halobacillus litoralis TaxID=45668 RepID=UPI001CD30366|nr:GntR family transcriptional regulator [Halobacillus litoralis]MCA0972040.1 GntR family transcriptional regulator [Halobacillus litoralis]